MEITKLQTIQQVTVVPDLETELRQVITELRKKKKIILRCT